MIETARLVLREWRQSDHEPFAAMLADPAVMRFLGPPQDRATADFHVGRQTAHLDTHGFTFWVVEGREDAAFLGFCGLRHVELPGAPINDEVEIGWRLRRTAWGSGYAHEAATASLADGFAKGLHRIVAYTVAANARSWGLMERLGMIRRPDLDFDHPRLAADDPLRPHIVYTAERP